MKELNTDRVRELFDYRDGVLYWKNHNHRVIMEKPSGYVEFNGYRRIKIGRKLYQASRLIWLWHGGALEKNKVIDHINGNTLDNNIENLRSISGRDNLNNLKRHRSGCLPGVYLPAGSKKYVAQIQVNEDRIYLATSNSEEYCGNIYNKARQLLELYRNKLQFRKLVRVHVKVDELFEDCLGVLCLM